MHKKDVTEQLIAEQLSKRTGLSLTLSKQCVDAILEIFVEALADGRKLFFRGLFSIEPFTTKGRMISDVKTRQQRWLPSRKKLRISTGVNLHNKLND